MGQIFTKDSKILRRVYNRVIFKQTFTDQLQSKFISKAVKQQFNNNDMWNFYSFQTNDQKVKLLNLFPYIKQSLHLALYITKTKIRQIPNQLILPSYIKLQIIGIPHNMISNIQKLAFIDCPQLRELDISNNLITQTKSLNKTKWQSFQLLSINNTYIKQLNINGMRMNNRKEIQLVLNIKYEQINKLIISKISFPKIQGLCLNKIGKQKMQGSQLRFDAQQIGRRMKQKMRYNINLNQYRNRELQLLAKQQLQH